MHVDLVDPSITNYKKKEKRESYCFFPLVDEPTELKVTFAGKEDRGKGKAE